jgi:hypothetical protein
MPNAAQTQEFAQESAQEFVQESAQAVQDTSAVSDRGAPVRIASAIPSLPTMARDDDAAQVAKQQLALAMPVLTEPVAAVPQPAPEPVVADVPLPRKRPANAPSSTQTASAGITLASASSRPVVLPRQITHARKPEHDPGVLNDAQIASIREKLHLTPDQERYWPGVEAALRRIAWDSKQMARHKRAVRPSEGPAIDMNGAGVAQLKSAAFPLVMSFTEDQKDEVRKFAHLIGLTKLAQEF